MEKYFIVPITKSPHKRGRLGPVQLQDWYQGVKKAVTLFRRTPNSTVLVISNVHIQEEEHEADIYKKTLSKFNIHDENLLVVKDCYETIGQIDMIKKIAKEQSYKLIFISTFLHFPRVWWLARGMNVKHCVAFGLPRPREAITDIILSFLFPIIDVLGGRVWFQEKVVGRREEGKF